MTPTPTLREALEEARTVCEQCDGEGRIPIQVCCGRRDPQGECCGEPDIDFDYCECVAGTPSGILNDPKTGPQ